MKRLRWIHLLSLAAVLFFTISCGPHAHANAIAIAPTIQLDHTTNRYPGQTVMISGTTSLTEVAVKVVRPNLTVAYIDFADVLGGAFTLNFIVPADATLGTYTVVAGKGAKVATDTFEVIEIPVQPSKPTPGTSTPELTPVQPRPQPSPNGSDGNSITLQANAISLQQATTTDGKTSVTAVVQAEALAEALRNLAKTGSSVQNVIISISGVYHELGVKLPAAVLAGAVANSPDAVIIVQSEESGYHLPVNLPALQSALRSLGVALKDATITVKTKQVSGQALQQMKAAATKAGIPLRTDGIEYTLSLEANGQTVEITNSGNTYVTRTMTIGGTVDSAHATAVFYEPVTGAFTFVPSLFEMIDSVTVVIMKRNGDGIYTVTEKGATFGDIANHWARFDIETMAAKRIVSGLPGHHYAPDQTMTRAELTSLIVRALGIAETRTDTTFKDVPADAWFAGAVATSIAAGLVEGMSETEFAPNAPVSREQAAVLLTRALHAAGKKADGLTKQQLTVAGFTDNEQISEWSKEAIAELRAVGIIQGFQDETFRPADHVSRAQAAVMIMRLLEHAGFINKQH